YIVRHHTQFIEELIKQGKLSMNGTGEALTYHDPCYLGRHNGVFDEPRKVIEATGAKLTEPERNRSNSFCCGAGGGQFWKEEEKGKERVSTNRFRQLVETGAKTVATGCPFCLKMFSDEAAKEDTAPEVLDIAEIVARNLKKSA
ncbi:MAG: (Fe-S)-binding protein, partial [Candidatus Binatia bacterium]